MSTVRERAIENVTGITAMLVLGLGFIALFANVSYFFVIWIIGFAVILPIVAMLFDEDEDESTTEKPNHETHVPAERSNANDSPTSDALSTLRDRYARGELTDEQFERKLDALLETEQPESAAEWRTRERIEERS